MTEYTAHSTHPGSDSIARAYRIREFLHVSNFEGGKYASTAMKPDAARTFARGILALADEIDGGEVAEAKEPAPSAYVPKVGDRVRVVRSEDSEDDGRTGIIGRVDEEDSYLPYRIIDGNGAFITWAAEVCEVVESAPSAPLDFPFAASVEEAKRLLTGTEHTGADIIALARELYKND